MDVILGMQWMHTLGVTEVDWRKLTLSFIQNEKKVVIRGDPSLTKTRVSLKHMMKTWTPSDLGFLIECRALEGGMTFAELYGIDDVPTIQELLPADILAFVKIQQQRSGKCLLVGKEYHHMRLHRRIVMILHNIFLISNLRTRCDFGEGE